MNYSDTNVFLDINHVINAMQGGTALMFAASQWDGEKCRGLDMVKLLLSKGANVNAKDHEVGRHNCCTKHLPCPARF